MKRLISGLVLSLFLAWPTQGAAAWWGGSPDADDLFSERWQHAAELSRKWNRADIAEAYEIFFELARNYEGAGAFKESAACLREAAAQKMILGEPAVALQLLHRALAMEEKGRNINGKVETLAYLAYLYSFIGKTLDSSRYIKKTEELFDKVESPNVRARICLYLGDAYYSVEDVPKVLKYHNKSLELFRESQDKFGEAKALFLLAYAYLGSEEINRAAGLAEEAVTCSRSLGFQRIEALSSVVLGLSYFKLGESQKALNILTDAKKLFPKDIDRSERAVMLYNLGRVYEYFGDCNESLKHFRNSADLLREDNNLAWLTGNLWTLGNLAFRCGNKEEALTFLKESEKLSLETNKPHGAIQSFIKLGDVYSDTGEYPLSKRYYERALSSLGHIQFDWSKALTHAGLGRLNEKIGRPDTARQNYHSALKISRKIKDGFTEAEILDLLARLDAKESNIANALYSIEYSIRSTEKLSIDIANSRLKTIYFSTVYDRYELYVNLLMRMAKERPDENFAERALQASERARARIMFENMQLAGGNLSKYAPIETIRREKELSSQLNSKRDRLTNLLSSNAPKEDVKKTGVEAMEVETELEQLKATLKQSDPIYSAIRDPAPFDVAVFQQNVLDEDSVFLEFSLGDEESYLWVVDKNEISHYVLLSRVEIESRTEKLLENLRSREMRKDDSIEDYDGRIHEADLIYSSEAAKLSHDLLGQAVEKIKGKRLIIAPDGKLGYLPFSALPFPNSKDGKPLVVTNEIVYTPSASILGLLKEKGQGARKTPAKDVLIFADPVFADGDERLRGHKRDHSIFATTLGLQRSADSIKNLGRLPASEIEAIEISDLSDSSKVLKGFEANRQRAMSSDLADYRVIHFATHGVFNKEHPELSGILLSLYDENGAPSEGFIRTHDIYGMNFNADLVVLSSCNSGVGREVRGEGMASLTNAFLQAGARSVVSSLWKIEDNATRELMREFYHALSRGTLTPAEALREAQVKMMQHPRYHAPFYWAAFTVQGDLNTKVVFNQRRYSCIGLIASFGILSVLLFFGLRKYRSNQCRQSSS